MFTNTKGAREIQLGEILFLNDDNTVQGAGIDHSAANNLQVYSFDPSTATVSASHSVQGGGTGREFPPNILNHGSEAWNKWYQASSSTASITVDFKAAHQFRGIGFRAANDCPHRDPDVAKVHFMINGAFTEVATFDLGLFGGPRWNTKKFLLPQAYSTDKV